MIPQAIENILFFDLETAPVISDYMELPEHMRLCWEKKAKQLDPEANSYASMQYIWKEKAALYPEFSQVVCIVAGFFNEHGFLIKRINREITAPPFVEAEKQMLEEFGKTLAGSGRFTLCGHNIKEFDVPFLCKRYIINGLTIPQKINFVNRKPWEIDVIDTMDICRFGVYKSFVSLDLLAASLGIPSPKEDMNGAQGRGIFLCRPH